RRVQRLGVVSTFVECRRHDPDGRYHHDRRQPTLPFQRHRAAAVDASILMRRRVVAFRNGIQVGQTGRFVPTLLYPVVVIGLITIAATFAGAVDLSKTNWQKALLNLVILTFSTALVAIITEEGFFRGCFWGSLR